MSKWILLNDVLLSCDAIETIEAAGDRNLFFYLQNGNGNYAITYNSKEERDKALVKLAESLEPIDMDDCRVVCDEDETETETEMGEGIEIE